MRRIVNSTGFNQVTLLGLCAVALFTSAVAETWVSSIGLTLLAVAAAAASFDSP